MGTKRREDWREIAKACEESGLSIWSWCKKNNVAYTSCREWVSRLRNEAKQPEVKPQELSVWGKVETKPEIERAFESYPYQSMAAIKLSYGLWSMEVSEGFDHGLLKQIMMVVEAKC